MKPTDPSNDREAELEPERNPAEVFPDYEPAETDVVIKDSWWTRVFSVRMGLAVAALVLVGVALYFSPRVYDKLKEFRAMRFVEEARRADAAGDAATAFGAFRQAFLIAPESEKVRRAGIRFSARLGDGASLRELEKLMANGEATQAEMLALAEGKLLTGDGSAAAAALKRLGAEDLPEDLAFARRKIELGISAASGRLTETMKELSVEIASRAPAQANELRLLGAKILLAEAQRTQDLSAAKRARDLLLEITGEGTRTRLEAQRLLAWLELAGVNVPDRKALVAELKEHPLREQGDVLMAATLEIAGLLRNRQEVIEGVKLAYRAGTKVERLAAAKWLLQQQAREDVLEFIGEEQAVTDHELFLVYGDALSGLGRWSDLGRLLQEQAVPGLDESIRHLFLMRVAMETKDRKQVELQWQEVRRHLRLADEKTVLYVARYAEAIGATAEAARVYEGLAGRSDAPLEALIGYLKYAPSDTSAKDLLSYYRRILALKPDFPEAQNDYAYLRLLLEQESAALLPEVRERYEKAEPKSLAYATTLALAELRNGHAAAAAAIYDAGGIELESGTDSQRAVRARILWESGQRETAKTLVQTIDRGKLRPSERKLIEDL